MKRYIKFVSLLTVMLLTISLAGCVSSDKAVVATVNGDKITKEEFTYFLASVKAQIESEQGSDITEDFWETAEVDGKKVIETAKEKALEEAVKAKLAKQKALAEGIKLTSAQHEDINSRIGQLVAKYGKDGVDEYLKQYGLNKELYEKVLEDSFYRQNLTEQLTSDVDEAAAKEFFNSKVVRVKHILFMTVDQQSGESLPVEQIEAAKIKADEILAKAKAGDSFDKLVEEFSQDPGSQQQPEGYYIGKGFALGQQGGMVSAFETASLELEVGGISDIVETNYGYHIIKRYENMPDEYEKNSAQLLSLAKNDKVEQLIEGWKAEAKIEKVDKEYNAMK